jgi:hypothetical protein
LVAVIYMERRERNHVAMEARRITTTHGMFGDLIARGERIRELALCKSDYGRDKCQEVQLIRVFGTHRLSGSNLARLPVGCPETGIPTTIMYPTGFY